MLLLGVPSIRGTVHSENPQAPHFLVGGNQMRDFLSKQEAWAPHSPVAPPAASGAQTAPEMGARKVGGRGTAILECVLKGGVWRCSCTPPAGPSDGALILGIVGTLGPRSYENPLGTGRPGCTCPHMWLLAGPGPQRWGCPYLVLEHHSSLSRANPEDHAGALVGRACVRDPWGPLVRVHPAEEGWGCRGLHPQCP